MTPLFAQSPRCYLPRAGTHQYALALSICPPKALWARVLLANPRVSAPISLPRTPPTPTQHLHLATTPAATTQVTGPKST